MTAVSSSNKDLLIADLRLRLAEAEETLRAIRDNEVDALVMRGPLAEEVFTIGGDTDSYRTFMEVMEPGAAARRVWARALANSALTRLLGMSLPRLQGKLLVDAFADGAAKEIGRLLSEAHTTRQSREVRFLGRKDRSSLHRGGEPIAARHDFGHAVTFANVTERVS